MNLCSSSEQTTRKYLFIRKKFYYFNQPAVSLYQLVQTTLNDNLVIPPVGIGIILFFIAHKFVIACQGSINAR